ncbi:hypothetical protein GJ633_06265 [Halorubrum sp. CBA1125]|uniref:DUF7288 family protein n=1 Tax=Halorubrum sp. CBA1125 TaxID=2668072 RepID=UPI0012E82995|nr:hypothetical protein [Halorubrum sp. CBA1125]MUW14306.1 hypothetical protein [Halorubrum sp. CBA1125]
MLGPGRDDRGTRRDDRAQAHTLEAFAAAILLVAGVTFALQATAVTPLSASTSNQHIENQQRAVANDLLATAAENGDLAEAVLYWDPGDGDAGHAFAGSPEESEHYAQAGPPTAFGTALNRTFLDRRVAFNVDVRYRTTNGTDSQRLVYMGTPSDNAVSATRTVPVADDTTLTAPGHEGATLESVEPSSPDDDSGFYAPDVGSGAAYNYLEVTVVVWRM